MFLKENVFSGHLTNFLKEKLWARMFSATHIPFTDKRHAHEKYVKLIQSFLLF